MQMRQAEWDEDKKELIRLRKENELLTWQLQHERKTTCEEVSAEMSADYTMALVSPRRVCVCVYVYRYFSSFEAITVYI